MGHAVASWPGSLVDRVIESLGTLTELDSRYISIFRQNALPFLTKVRSNGVSPWAWNLQGLLALIIEFGSQRVRCTWLLLWHFILSGSWVLVVLELAQWPSDHHLVSAPAEAKSLGLGFSFFEI